MTAASRLEVEEFREMIVEHLGLVFEEHKIPELAAILNERLAATGCGEFRYYRPGLSSSATSREEWRLLAERLTIGETYFFRNPDQFRAFLEVALPRLLAMDRPRREIRLLSAGCASGEEPCTLAILLQDRKKQAAELEFSISAIDVNPASLQRAREGRYTRWSLRQMPPGYRERLFRPDGHDFILDPGARASVSFGELNLLDPAPWFWGPNAFDAIFCRNVLMYFSQEVARQVVGRLARALLPGGFLFLGHAETLRGISQAFHLIHSHDTFYYQRQASLEDRGDEIPEGPLDAGTAPPPPAPVPAGPALPPDLSWCESIDRASQRIAALTGSAPGEGPAAATMECPPAGDRPAEEEAVGPWKLGPALKALEEERFGEARDLLKGLPRAAEKDPEALLLHAAVLTNCGELTAARNVLASLLSLDQLNPGGQYLMGFCCQQAGEGESALVHYRSAIYLDPDFAMPHLQIGSMTRRGGDLGTARRELRQALDLLHREDAARILLFGGGFHRSALLALCRAELRAAGESRP
jgi:chemotaxis protein methyltransferase CheR